MRRWHTRHNAELLVAMILVVGGVLSGILWLKQRANMPSSLPLPAMRVVDPQQAHVVVAGPVPPAATTAALPRACAQAMRPAPLKSDNARANGSVGDDVQLLAGMDLAIPVAGIERVSLYDSFVNARGTRTHEAIDIHAPRGTPVIAAGDGCVAKLFRSVAGGITLYQFDSEGNFAYYYAHMERYAEGMKEGTLLKRGDVLGYVGTTGNAPPSAPHLHFAIFRLGPEKRWWVGTAVNPYMVFTYP